MSAEEKNAYIKGLEYNFDLDPEDLEADIYSKPQSTTSDSLNRAWVNAPTSYSLNIQESLRFYIMLHNVS